MAYEFRQPANYASGLLKNAAAVSDTALVSDDFIASLAAGLSNTTYVPITLQDPAAKTYEIVWATGHVAGSNSATVLRGREGTIARAWPSSTLWTCAPTIRDGLFPTTRANLPADPHIGMRAALSDESRVLTWNGSAWTTGNVVTLPRPNATLGWSAATSALANSTTYTVATLAVPDPGCPYYIEASGGFTVANADDRGAYSHSITIVVDSNVLPAAGATSIVTNSWLGPVNTQAFGHFKAMRARSQQVWTGAHTLYMLLRTGTWPTFTVGPLNTQNAWQFDAVLIPA